MRSQMKLNRISAAIAVALIATTLTACSGGAKSTGEVVNVYNWGEYIDDSVNAQFTKETGIKVNYNTYPTNEELYARLKGGGVQYDVIIPSDYMIGRMIKENMIEKLDFKNIPNYKDIDSRYKGLSFDPKNEYSVPYTWGVVGIVYNKTMVKEKVDSWNILWDEKYKGKILMFDNSRDALGIALKKLGYSYNTNDETQLKAAAAELEKQKPLVQAYVMDQIFDKMEGGEAALAPYYAGDAITMMNESPDLGFAIPKEGTNLFVDSMCIPKGAKNKTAAEKYINFMTSAEISAKNSESIGYSTPSTKALEKLPEETRKNPFAYPDQSIISKAEVYQNLPEKTLDLYDQLWTDIISK